MKEAPLIVGAVVIAAGVIAILLAYITTPLCPFPPNSPSCKSPAMIPEYIMIGIGVLVLGLAFSTGRRRVSAQGKGQAEHVAS